MAMLEEKMGMASKAEQETAFASGNEMAALAAAQINYHIMGYFPITPSTEIAQLLDQMKLRGNIAFNSFQPMESTVPPVFATARPLWGHAC